MVKRLASALTIRLPPLKSFPFYSFTAPISTPFAKCFCRNGYTHMMGNIAQMIVAMRSAIGGGSCAPTDSAPLRNCDIMDVSVSTRRSTHAKG